MILFNAYPVNPFDLPRGVRNKILYKRFFYCLASALTASILSHAIKPMKPFLDISNQVPSITVVDLLTLFLISITVTVVCILYIWLYQGFHDRFVRSYWKGHGWLKPAFGLVLAGVIMIPIYGTLMNMGYVGGYSGKLMPFDDLDISRMVLVGIVLFLTSALIAASGNSGGLVMPIMTFGAIFGVCIASFFSNTDPLIFAAAGLTAAVATALNVPVAAAVICMELFGLPAFLPAMFGALSGYFIGKRYVIYHEIQWKKII
ncbi:MAG: chloride channel protein [Thermoplasmatota archaeon]